MGLDQMQLDELAIRPNGFRPNGNVPLCLTLDNTMAIHESPMPPGSTLNNRTPSIYTFNHNSNKYNNKSSHQSGFLAGDATERPFEICSVIHCGLCVQSKYITIYRSLV